MIRDPYVVPRFVTFGDRSSSKIRPKVSVCEFRNNSREERESDVGGDSETESEEGPSPKGLKGRGVCRTEIRGLREKVSERYPTGRLRVWTV